MPSCELLKSLVTRIGVLLAGACLYVGYTFLRIQRGDDQRCFTEFAAMFFMLGCQQMSGGLILGVFSYFHEAMHERGFDALSWYAANFDAETVTTLSYLQLLKQWLQPSYFALCRAALDKQHLALGVVTDPESKKFCAQSFFVQFIFSVVVSGLTARVLSLMTIVLLTFIPHNPVEAMASLYYTLPLSCFGRTVLLLYLKPAVIDGLIFIISDKILRGKPPTRGKTGQKRPLLSGQGSFFFMHKLFAGCSRFSARFSSRFTTSWGQGQDDSHWTNERPLCDRSPDSSVSPSPQIASNGRHDDFTCGRDSSLL